MVERAGRATGPAGPRRDKRRAPGYTALVVDDEPIARAELTHLVSGLDWLRCVGEAGSGPEALEKIRSLRPDVVFLDIEMPGASGLEVAQSLESTPLVVFTTAYSDYAVPAFGVGAVDYLLKPFGETRFLDTAGRLRRHLDAARRDRRERLQEITLEGLPARRVFVREKGRMLGVDVQAIVRLDADGDYVRIRTQGKEFLVYERLRELHRRLDEAEFVRVHRSHVVNVAHIRSLSPAGGGRLNLHFKDGSTLTASRRYSRNLRRLVV